MWDAADTIILSDTLGDLQILLNKIAEVCDNMGLIIHTLIFQFTNSYPTVALKII